HRPAAQRPCGPAALATESRPPICPVGAAATTDVAWSRVAKAGDAPWPQYSYETGAVPGLVAADRYALPVSVPGARHHMAASTRPGPRAAAAPGRARKSSPRRRESG